MMHLFRKGKWLSEILLVYPIIILLNYFYPILFYYGNETSIN